MQGTLNACEGSVCIITHAAATAPSPVPHAWPPQTLLVSAIVVVVVVVVVVVWKRRVDPRILA